MAHGKTKTYYDAYKETSIAATNEVRKSKRNFEHTLAQNIKSDSNLKGHCIEFKYYADGIHSSLTPPG